MDTKIIETVTFKLAEGADEKSFRESLAATFDFASSCDGFLRRALSRGPEDLWQDMVEWSSKEAAESAGKAFMNDPRNTAFMQSIDPSSVKMRHGELVAERT
jgi:hypothetical protein